MNSLGLPAFGQEAASEAPEPVPFPGDGVFNNHPPFLAGVTVDHADNSYREGDRLRIQFMAERDAHLYLIYHQADRQSRLLFPNESQPENRVSAKQAVVVPDMKQPLRFRIQPPFGTEVLQVIASVERLPLLDGLVTKTGRAPEVSQTLLDQLHEQLAKNEPGWTEHRVLLRTFAKAPPEPPRKAARVGLFIGIGKYLRPDLCHTHEELSNSARVMHELLVKQGGLDPAKTKLVLDEQATKANMQQLITRWLPSVSQPGDTVFVYFSGHAGQYDTRDPSEADGKDENIAPYDFDAGPTSWPAARQIAHSRASSILDDTLARWLQALSGRQLVLIFDTCHAGGLVEGKELGNREQGTGNSGAEPSVGNALRGVPRGEGVNKVPLPPHPQTGTRGRGEGRNKLPLPPGEGRGEGGKPAVRLDLFTDEAARLKDISQLNTIVITSCASDEQSLFEGIQNKTMWFTSCLTDAMTNPKAPHPLSVQDAFNYARLRMKQLLIEGNAGREQEPMMADNVLVPILLVP